MSKKLTLPQFRTMKEKGESVVFITAYDFPLAQCCEAAGVDLILVGDSVGMTTLGYENTLPVTMDEMIHHCKAVRKGAPHTFLIGDMPLGSYQISDEEAVRNALRFVKEAGCDAVKCEGGVRVAKQVKAMVDAGIVVMGHLGLTPQSVSQQGGYRVQGKTPLQQLALHEDAFSLQEAGASFILLEAMPPETARGLSQIPTVTKLAEGIHIPLYGIGTGPHVDGQLLIIHDVLGLFQAFKPKFAKRYLEGSTLIQEALKTYAQEVRAKEFPQKEHWYE